MKITEKLPQFDQTPSLLIVTGWQSGKIFFVKDGEVDLIEDIEIEKRKYSDNEGFFKAKSRNVGGMYSGISLEEDKNIIRKEFLEELMPKLDILVKEKNIREIYVFSPDEGLHSLDKHLNKDIKSIIKGFYSGNYTNHGPFDLLKKIQDEQPKPIEVMSEEAKKILDKK